MSRVVVVGSGAAGTAAALAARAAGAEVTLVRGGTGATSLTSGALDGAPVEESIVAALELYALGPCTLATVAGIARAAAGRDRALCDISASKTVLIARVTHPGWDADALAAGLSEHDRSRSYVARDVALVAYTREHVMKHGELAALHDAEDRLASAGARIREALEDAHFDTVLLPPWLGVTAPRAEALSKHVGVRCGEVLVGDDSPAGLRFEQARDRCLRGITTREGRVSRVTATATGCNVETSSGMLDCEAVVLASGGLIAGGIRYTPGGLHLFELALSADVTLGHDGKPLVVPGSLLGVAPESLFEPAGAPILERVGILRCGERIFAAGDVVADQPRTMLAAFESGARAGAAASRAA